MGVQLVLNVVFHDTQKQFRIKQRSNNDCVASKPLSLVDTTLVYSPLSKLIAAAENHVMKRLVGAGRLIVEVRYKDEQAAYAAALGGAGGTAGGPVPLGMVPVVGGGGATCRGRRVLREQGTGGEGRVGGVGEGRGEFSSISVLWYHSTNKICFEPCPVISLVWYSRQLEQQQFENVGTKVAVFTHQVTRYT